MGKTRKYDWWPLKDKRLAMPTKYRILKFMTNHEEFMSTAVKAALQGMSNNEGGPFGCIIVKDGKVIGSGNNKVTSTNDPTAHAEVTAIRDACKNIGSFQLDGCIIYTCLLYTSPSPRD